MSLDKPMGYKPLLLALILICTLSLDAQIRHYDPSNSTKIPVMGVNGNLGITGVGDNYDVNYYRLEMYINPDTVNYLRGNLTMYYQTLESNFSQVIMDYRATMLVDSVFYRGVKLDNADITRSGDELRVNLPVIRPINFQDSLTVYYRGVPETAVSGTGWVRTTHNAGSNNYIYTLSEPYSARNWWPCKLAVQDKADSLDMIIKTPSAFKAAGNGTLVSETVTGAYRTVFWKHRYPIPAYLVATAVANYQVYNSANVVISGTSMPVYHYIFPESNTATAKTTLDRVRLMLTSMSTAFGDYPYKLEKYGHYQFGFSGGMEHATFSGMNGSTFDGSTDWSVIAHELGHQWFGDKVTCGSWKDIWVNEGFAKFSELIAAENVPALNTYLASHRSTIKSNATGTSYRTGTTYRNDTTSLTSIFSPSIYIYDRGAMILNMLRATLGDTKFFNAIRNYTSDPLLAYKNAFTDDVKRHMENVSGLNLTDFFNDWIYNNGHATYAISYGFSANYVGIRAVQSRTSGSSATYFDMPLQFRVSNATRDTIITLFDNDGILNVVSNGTMSNWGLNNIGVRLSFTPTSITFDPNSQVMASATMSVNSALPIRRILLSGKSSSSKNILSVDASFTGVINKVILERSIDGQDFDELKSIENPEASESFAMNMEDVNPTFNDLYYRIKLIMNDGEIGYSNIIKLSNQDVNSDIVIYPNAATDFFNVAVKSNSEKVQVKIFTQDGKLKEVRQAIGKNILVKFNSVSWTKGFYLVEIHDGSTIQRRKLLIH